MTIELRELLEKVKHYIEYCEEKIDGEWGMCRDIDELIASGEMPSVYTEVIDALGDAL